MLKIHFAAICTVRKIINTEFYIEVLLLFRACQGEKQLLYEFWVDILKKKSEE